MKVLSFALRGFSRDLRAGELSILLAAVIVAVTAMTAVAFFTDRVGAAMKDQASQVLAADLVLRSAAPVNPDYLSDAEALGLETAETIAFPTVVLSGQQTALAAIDAVSGGYPLRGQVTISDTLFGNGRPANGVPGRGEAWADPGLLGRLGLEVGASVTLGETALRITRVLQYKPDQNIGFMNLAPGLLVNIDDVPGFGVVKPGSRVTYNQMFAGSERAIAGFRQGLVPRLRPDESLRGREDAGEQINAAIDRAQRFLALASLVTVILAAVAAAMAARRYALRHLDNIALMKTLGATQGFVIAVTVTELAFVIALDRGGRRDPRLWSAVRAGGDCRRVRRFRVAPGLGSALPARGSDGRHRGGGVRVATPAERGHDATAACAAQGSPAPATQRCGDLRHRARGNRAHSCW